MSRKLNFSILIICEGEKTEPFYFKYLIERSKADKIWNNERLYYKISPEPEDEDEEHLEKVHPLKSQRKKRSLKNTDIVVIDNEYKAVPVRFVREAQLKGLVDNQYDEVWAVFDHDNHPKRFEAFELAATEINGQKVNIAFSSIAFEIWILYHFEFVHYDFLTSECREGKVKLDCGVNINNNGCDGERCVVGYMRENSFLEEGHSTKNKNVFELTYPRIEVALINASRIRYLRKNIAIYNQSCYTDVDRLVNVIFKKKKEYKWLSIEELYESGEIKFFFSRNDENLLELDMVANRTFLIKENDFKIRAKNYNVIGSSTTKLLVTGEQPKTINFPVLTMEYSVDKYLTVDIDVVEKYIFVLALS